LDDGDSAGSRGGKRKQLCRIGAQKLVIAFEPRLRFLIAITEEMFMYNMNQTFLELIEQFLSTFPDVSVVELAKYTNIVFTESGREAEAYRELFFELEHSNGRVI
jgi:hypothetical protein